MSAPDANFTIIVNWRERGFGCAKVCSYCNWRDSPMLPHGGQSAEAIARFAQQCSKSFITISGGGDPLYRFPEYGAQLLAMAAQVTSLGYRVRVITREVEHVAGLRGLVDGVSVSLDADVLGALPHHSPAWEGMDVEYSLVLPPLPTSEIVRLQPQYAALHRVLGRRLVLRENLNSIHPLDFSLLRFGHSGIVHVPKALCLHGRYLTTIDCTGHQLVQDNVELAGCLMGDARVYLFGGFVRHLLNPVVHLEYGDIDVLAVDSGAMADLSQRFGFTFTEVSPPGSHPRYFIGRSTRAGKTIQLVLMTSKGEALGFVMNAQYDADRVAYSNCRYHFDPAVGEARTRMAIDTKVVNVVTGPRDLHLFNHNRPLVEQRHHRKLIAKGFTIIDEKDHAHASNDLHHPDRDGHGARTGGA